MEFNGVKTGSLSFFFGNLAPLRALALCVCVVVVVVLAFFLTVRLSMFNLGYPNDQLTKRKLYKKKEGIKFLNLCKNEINKYKIE